MSYQMRRRPRWYAGAGAGFVTALAVLTGSLAASSAPASADNTTTTDPSATTAPSAGAPRARGPPPSPAASTGSSRTPPS
jgi:hypothetical protein